ncbi:Hpt domain-containing protein [Streptacidiphilus rugosus]|uniref:Hpt domain-containing protein n=1 Tax=Streptacidiphilus rugosus TaxID=405783 RepID=UPI00068D6EF9|nr:Hpt domain-containing protein [Streptacidiphilus rugosus]
MVSVLNRAVLQELVDSLDAEFAVQLIDVFLDDSAQLVDEIRGGLEGRDADRLRRAAHTLKSNGQTFGLDQLAPLCRELEGFAVAEQWQSAADTAAQVPDAYRAARRALEEARKEYGHVGQ